MGEGTDSHELEKLRALNDPIQDVEKNGATDKRTSPSIEKYQIILEPALIGAMMAINLGQTSIQNFYLQTACTVDLGFPKNVCNSGVGEEFRSAEEASQRVVSQVNISRSFIGCLIATVVLLFVGPWSDCSGRRKPLLIMPLLGMSVMSTVILLLLTFPGASTVHVLYAVQIPISLGGNFGLLLAAAFSHIGDLSSLLYVVLKVKDVNVNTDNEVSVVNWRLPLNAVKCLVKPRQGNRRKIILLMLVVALGDRMLLSAEVLLAYMFYRRKFNWDDVMFGSFLAYRNIVSFLGTLLILTVLKRAMRLSDECVGILSCISYVLSASGLIAARTTVSVFILPIIGIISQGSQVVQRPILNKQILPTEQGKIYSVMGALESATQTLSSPLYSLLYSKTISSNPDAWLAPGIVLAVLQLSSYLYTRTLKKNTIDDRRVSIKNIEMKKEIQNRRRQLSLGGKIGDDLTDVEKLAAAKSDIKV